MSDSFSGSEYYSAYEPTSSPTKEPPAASLVKINTIVKRRTRQAARQQANPEVIEISDSPDASGDDDDIEIIEDVDTNARPPPASASARNEVKFDFESELLGGGFTVESLRSAEATIRSLKAQEAPAPPAPVPSTAPSTAPSAVSAAPLTAAPIAAPNRLPTPKQTATKPNVVTTEVEAAASGPAGAQPAQAAPTLPVKTESVHTPSPKSKKRKSAALLDDFFAMAPDKKKKKKKLKKRLEEASGEKPEKAGGVAEDTAVSEESTPATNPASFSGDAVASSPATADSVVAKAAEKAAGKAAGSPEHHQSYDTDNDMDVGADADADADADVDLAIDAGATSPSPSSPSTAADADAASYQFNDKNESKRPYVLAIDIRLPGFPSGSTFQIETKGNVRFSQLMRTHIAPYLAAFSIPHSTDSSSLVWVEGKTEIKPFFKPSTLRIEPPPKPAAELLSFGGGASGDTQDEIPPTTLTILLIPAEKVKSFAETYPDVFGISSKYLLDDDSLSAGAGAARNAPTSDIELSDYEVEIADTNGGVDLGKTVAGSRIGGASTVPDVDKIEGPAAAPDAYFTIGLKGRDNKRLEAKVAPTTPVVKILEYFLHKKQIAITPQQYSKRVKLIFDDEVIALGDEVGDTELEEDFEIQVVIN